MSRSQFAWSLALAMCAASAPAFADTLVSDGTFILANYSMVGPFQSLGTITGTSCATCGNPGSALQFNEAFGDTTSATGEAALGFVNNASTYNPLTQGALISIDASVDKNATVTGITGTLGNTFRPLIEQDGIYYLAAIVGTSFVPPSTAPFTTGFISFSESGLVATDFLEFDFTTGAFGTTSPNFDGDALKFGLAQVTTLAGVAAGATLQQDYDNLNITSTPEPSSVLLLSTLALLVAFALRRMRLRVS